MTEGKLIKVRSEGSATCQWLQKTWTNHYPDITYISANAFVNSKNVLLCNFNGNKHFGRVIDTWIHGFDKKTRRVDAYKINEDAYKYIKDERYILHYQQPHAPYLFLEKDSSGGFKKPLILRQIINFFIPIKMQWKFVSFHPYIKRKLVKRNKYSRMYSKYGMQKVREAYERNLLSVLLQVKRIVKLYPDKNIVITSDHGERLGEDGQFGHGGELDEFITTVPFYYVERRNK